jgi:hypothetical protein
MSYQSNYLAIQKMLQMMDRDRLSYQAAYLQMQRRYQPVVRVRAEKKGAK